MILICTAETINNTKILIKEQSLIFYSISSITLNLINEHFECVLSLIS